MIEYVILDKVSDTIIGQGDCFSLVEFNHHVSFASVHEPNTEYILIENPRPEIIEACRETDDEGKFVHRIKKHPTGKVTLEVRQGKSSRLSGEKVIKG